MEELLKTLKNSLTTRRRSQHLVDTTIANTVSRESHSATETASYYAFLNNSNDNKEIKGRIRNALRSINIQSDSISKIYKNLNGFSLSIKAFQAKALENHFDIASVELDRIMPYCPAIELKKDNDSNIFTRNQVFAENTHSQPCSGTNNKYFGMEPLRDYYYGKDIENQNSDSDGTLSANALYSYGNTIASSGEVLPYGVRAVWEGEDISLQGNIGSGSYAFVIDSGVLDTTGDLLLNKIWSKSWVTGEDAFSDGNGHGTHVAGTIAALANGKGVVGVAPGAEVISLKVFDNAGNGANYSTIIDAIDHAAEIILNNKLDKSKVVINMSLGGPFSQGLDQAVRTIANQGIKISVAAGNNGVDADTVSPASAGDHENVYAVSAVDSNYQTAWWSNYDDATGIDDVDFSAPGVNVYSYYKGGELAYLSGTSMASPHVAGLLISGGIKEGDMAGANWSGYADPFALAKQSIVDTPPPDTTPPNIAISSSSSSIEVGKTALISFQLSEDSSDFNLADISVANGSLSNFSGTGSSYTAVLSPANNGATQASISVASNAFSDAAGNFNQDGNDSNNSLTFSITPPPDTTPPNIAISSSSSSIEVGKTALISFQLSEDSSDFNLADISVANGSLSNFSGTGSSYTAVLSPANNGATQASISVASNAFSDAAGNFNQDGNDSNNSLTFSITPPPDTTPPNIAISSSSSSIEVGKTALISFQLSEDSSDFNLADISVANGSLSNFSGTGSSYTAVLSPANNGATQASISVASNAFSDAAGNFNQDGNDSNNSLTFSITPPPDTTPPNIAISSSSSSIEVGKTALISFQLSEDSSDFNLADISVANGSLSNFSGTGSSYTAVLSPANNGATQASISVASNAFSDAAGNFNQDGNDSNNSLTFSITPPPDTTPPNIAISSSSSSIEVGKTALISFQLSEDSSDFNLADISVANGSLSNFSGTGSSYTAVLSPANNGATQASISVASNAFSDAAGNFNQDGNDSNNSLTFSITPPPDTTPPNIAISSSSSSIEVGKTALISFQLSEDSSDFNLADISVANGSLSNFSGTGSSYTAVLSPANNGATQASISVASNAFSDAAGNFNQDGNDSNNSLTFSITPPPDTTPPNIAISSSSSSIEVGKTALISFQLSEDSSDFNLADISVANGSLSNFSGTGSSYTAVLSPANNGATQASISVASNAFSDAAGNFNQDGNDSNNSLTFSITPPPDTTPPNIAISSSSSSIEVGKTALISFQLSEDSSDFNLADISVANGSLSNFSGTGSSYTAVLSPANNGATQASISVASNAFSDAAGNFNQDGNDSNNSLTFSITPPPDTTPPNIAISSSSSSIEVGKTALISFQLSEDSSDFNLADISVANGSLSNFSGTGSSYTAVLSPANNGATQASISVASNAFSDAAGNFNQDGNDSNNSLTFSITPPPDTTPPNIAISSSSSSIEVGKTALISFQLSEDSSDFNLADISVANGSLSNFSGTGSSYTAVLSPANNGATQASISVASNAFSDAAGNFNQDGNDSNNSLTFSITPPPDTTPPNIAISSSSSSIEVGKTALISFQLSEDSSDFNLADISVANGSLSNFSGTGSSYTAVLSPANNGATQASISVASNAFSDAAGNFNQDGNDSNNSLTFSITPPPDTTPPEKIPYQISYLGNAALKGGSIALSNGNQSVSQDQLENGLNLNSGTLDTDLNNSKSARNATEGSAFSISWQAHVGDTISFDYIFKSYDYAPFADFSFYTINSNAYSLVALGEPNINSGETTGTFSHTFSQNNFANGITQTVNVSIGVVDALDTFVNTSLTIDYISIINTQNNISPPDTTPPNIAISSSSSSIEVGKTALISFQLSEDSSDFNLADISVANGSLSNFSGTGSSYTAVLSPANNGATQASISVASNAFSDAAGNFNQDGNDSNNSLTFSITPPPDTTPPNIAISSSSSSIEVGKTALISFQLSEDSSDFNLADISVANGSLSNFSGTGSSYTAVLSPANNGATQASISVASNAFSDAAGNFNQDGNDSNNSLTFSITPPPDTTPPNIAISSSSSSIEVGKTALISFQLSEDSSDFNLADISVANGSLSNFSGTGSSYTAVLSPANNGATQASISVASNAFSDAAGNFNQDGNDSNNSLTFSITPPPDTTPPNIAISSSSSSIEVGKTALISFQLSEDSSDFNLADISVANGSLSNFSGTGSSYTAVLSPANNGATQASISVASNAFSDAAGNFNQDGNDSNNSLTFSITPPPDTTPPNIAISSSSSSIEVGKTALISFQLSEDSSDFNLADISVANGSLSNFSGTGSSYTAVLSPANNGATQASISVASNAFSDAAGNFNQDGNDSNNSLTFSITPPPDTTPPNIAISSSSSSIEVGKTALISFQLSEDSSDFNLADISVANGSLSNFSGTGSSYTAVLSPANNGATQASISVASNAFSDAAGNFNQDGNDSNNSLTFSITPPPDTTPPNIAISSSSSSIEVGKTALISFQLSEDSSDFNLADISVANGSLSNFSGTGSSYTAVLSPANNGATQASISVASNAFSDAAGNFNQDGNDSNNSLTFSITPPPDTTPPEKIPYQISYLGNAALKGGSIALSNGNQSVSQDQLENGLNLNSGTLDTDLNNSKSARNATEGSAFSISWQAHVGDTISFDYIFKSYDYAPFADFSFYTINSNAYSLVALGEPNINSGETTGTFSHTFSQNNFANGITQTVNVSIGVVDVLDTFANSELDITGLEIARNSLDSHHDKSYENQKTFIDPVTGMSSNNPKAPHTTILAKEESVVADIPLKPYAFQQDSQIIHTELNDQTTLLADYTYTGQISTALDFLEPSDSIAKTF